MPPHPKAIAAAVAGSRRVEVAAVDQKLRAFAHPLGDVAGDPLVGGARHDRAHLSRQVGISGPFAANNSEALRQAAEAGLGIALIPDFTAQASIETGALVQVLPQWQAIGTFADKLYAMRPYSLHTPRSVTLLVRHLREALRGGFQGKS